MAETPTGRVLQEFYSRLRLYKEFPRSDIPMALFMEAMGTELDPARFYKNFEEALAAIETKQVANH